MGKIFFYGLAILVFSISLQWQNSKLQPFSHQHKPQYQKWIEEKFFPKHSNKQLTVLNRSLIFGNKRGMRQQHRQHFSELYALHLFTPSGLHLSSLLIFCFFLFKKPLYRLCLVSLLMILIYSSPGFYSLKRMVAIKWMKLATRSRFFALFALVFFLDFAFGSYKNSPLSFCFSFLFLGGILISNSKAEVFKSFFIGNLIVCIFFQTPYNPLANGLGIILSSFVSALYPFYLFSVLLSPIIRGDLNALMLEGFLQLGEFFHSLSTLLPSFYPHFLMLLFFLPTSHKKKLVFLLFILYCSPLNFGHRSKSSTTAWKNKIIYPAIEAQRIKKIRREKDYTIIEGSILKCRLYRDGGSAGHYCAKKQRSKRPAP